MFNANRKKSLQEILVEGDRHFLAGRHDSAMKCYKQAIAKRDDCYEAHNNLGALLASLSQYDDAARHFRKALALRPSFAESHNNLGKVLANQGDIKQAIDCFRQATSIKNDFIEAHANLGKTLMRLGRCEEARQSLATAVRLAPENPALRIELAMAHSTMGQYDQAECELNQALRMNPNLAAAHNQLGILHASRNQPLQAMNCFRRAVELEPDFAQGWNNLGNELYNAGELDEAIGFYRKAQELNPQLAEAHFNEGLYLLLNGKMPQGWAKHEWRNKIKPLACLRDGEKQWDGREVNTLLVKGEQGFGDTIQFVRYLPLIRPRCKRLVLACTKQLLPLLGQIAGADEVVCDYSAVNPDAYIGAMSLPAILGTTLETIPANIPYLSAPKQLIEQWKSRMIGGVRNVGLAWAGSPGYARDTERSTHLSVLKTIGEATGVVFHSLQVGPRAAEARMPPGKMRIIDHSDMLTDFAQSAALIAALDLVITVDTVATHLAGAMKKPVWVMIPHVPDWRWMLDRQDSPWYPTVRLFRQPERGDWESVAKSVLEKLNSGETK